MEVTIAELLTALWRSYVARTPQAERIRQLLTQRGEILCDDHIALRTFGAGQGWGPGVGIDALARPFEALGWRAHDRYRCRDTHVRARHWQHDDDALPKLLISELVVDELSSDAQALIASLVEASPPELPWRGACGLTLAGYRALAAESEYAAWLAAFGPGVHHFTVDVDSLSTFPDLEALAAFLVEHGFRIHDTGGAFKGRGTARPTPIERLSTRPDTATVAFADGAARVPSCRYQFARRYRLPGGQMFHGLLPPSADRVEIDVALSV